MVYYFGTVLNLSMFVPFSAQPLPEFTSIVIRQSPPPQPEPGSPQGIREVALESLPEMVTELFDPLPTQQQLTPVPPATVVAPTPTPQPLPAGLSSLIPCPQTTTMTVISLGSLPRMTTAPAVTATVLSGNLSPVVSPVQTVYGPIAHHTPPPPPPTLFFEKKAVVKTEINAVASPAGLVDTSTPLSEVSSSHSLIPDMITDLQDLTDLLNSDEPKREDANSIMENLYADISQAKMEQSTPYNTRNNCWESGSSSSATSSGSHFEFSDLSLSDFGMSETIGSDWPDIKSITT